MKQPEIGTHFADGSGAIEIRNAIEDETGARLHGIGLMGLENIVFRSDKYGGTLTLTYENTTEDRISQEADKVALGLDLPPISIESPATDSEQEHDTTPETKPRRALRLSALLSSLIQ